MTAFFLSSHQSMNKTFSSQYFGKDSMPKWPCPSCEDGRVLLQKDSFQSGYDATTKREGNEIYFEPEHYRSVFTCMLECDVCRESVAVGGTGGTERYVNECGPDEIGDYYTPTFFQPALQIIDLRNVTRLPDKIRGALEKSFPLFWCDYDACANRLRTTVESLLDELGVPRTEMQANKLRRISLHSRIARISVDSIPQIDVVKPMLLAVKWIGNDGSHQLEGISREDLINAYEMLEHCLIQIYCDSRSAELLSLANAINSSRQRG